MNNVTGFIVGLLAGLICHGTLQAAEEKAKPQYKRGVLIRFDREITQWSEQFLYRKLAVARQRNADLIVIEIDSPGGELYASENMATRLRDIEWAHTVAYIPHKALSGAAVLSLGCTDIVMDPNARLGDAGVIFLDEDFMFKYADEKIRSDVARFVRDLASAKGRAPALAEAMIDQNLAVFKMTNQKTNEVTYMTEDEIASLENSVDWVKGKRVLESRDDKFLIVSGTRAVELNLANGYAETHNELREIYELDDEFVILEYGWVDTAVLVLNFPLVTGLLFIIGLVALYVELSAPGISVGGLISGLCFSLFFWSRFLGGTADWLEVILFLCGIVFILMEIFVIPGFGVSGVTGLLLILVSLVMASQNFIIPSTSHQLATSTNSLVVILVSGVGFVIVAAVISRYLGSLPVIGALVLKPPTGETTTVDPNQKGALPDESKFPVAVGDWGVADSPLRPAGKAKFENEYVDVVADGTYIDPGDQVRVIDLSGNRILVRKVEEMK